MADVSERPATHVLIIDDDAISLQLFEDMLIDEGYSVHGALTVDAGLEEVALHPPAAILLDLHLPGVDGLECLKRLRSEPLNLTIPVAVLTGDYFLDDEVARSLQALGAQVHFKPVWDTDVSRIVKDLLSGRVGR